MVAIRHPEVDTAGEPVALTAQHLRRFAEVVVCGGWMDGLRPSIQPPQTRTHEPLRGELAQKGVRQRYILITVLLWSCGVMHWQRMTFQFRDDSWLPGLD